MFAKYKNLFEILILHYCYITHASVSPYYADRDKKKHHTDSKSHRVEALHQYKRKVSYKQRNTQA